MDGMYHLRLLCLAWFSSFFPPSKLWLFYTASLCAWHFRHGWAVPFSLPRVVISSVSALAFRIVSRLISSYLVNMLPAVVIGLVVPMAATFSPFLVGPSPIWASGRLLRWILPSWVVFVRPDIYISPRGQRVVLLLWLLFEQACMRRSYMIIH